MSEISNSNCFIEKKERTFSNFIETGLFFMNYNRIFDNTVKEKLYEEIENRLNGIVSEEILKALVEY